MEVEELGETYYGLEFEKMANKFWVKLVKKPKIRGFPEFQLRDIGLVDKITLENVVGNFRTIENKFHIAGILKSCKIKEINGYRELSCKGIKEEVE